MTSSSERAFRNAPNAHRPSQPRLFGTHGAVASESYLATQAGADMLKQGGNAVDAGVAAAFVEGTANPQMYTIGGECPILVRMAETGRVVCVNGNTAAPGRATVDAYRERGLSDVPDSGILAAGVPAAFGALLTTLMHFGRLPLRVVLEPTLRLCEEGMPAHQGLVAQEKFGIRAMAEMFRSEWPGSAALYLPDGQIPVAGQVLRNPALADLFKYLIHEEHRARGGRENGLRAALDGFYRGDVAAAIAAYSRDRDGLLDRDDMSSFETLLEQPVSVEYGNTRLYKCGFWNQGPALLQCLTILRHFDLQAMGHNSADYIHHLVEAIKLGFADREQYYGDPRHVSVPEELLSDDYGRERAKLIDPQYAQAEIMPGDPAAGQALLPVAQRLGGRSWGPGTVHVNAADAEGNMIALTPSGGWIKSAEVMPELGFPLGNRLMTFYLEPEHHPNRVAPYKRPRTTISPSLAEREGKPWTVFGTMGGDQQDQWQLQYFLNRVVFGMTVPEAIDAPKLSSEHFPGFFAPHSFFGKRVRVESRVGAEIREELARRGHDVDAGADWSEGFMLATERDADTGVLETGCDPRGAKGEVFAPLALAW